MDRRSMMLATAGLTTVAFATDDAMAQSSPERRPDQRLGQTFRFSDHDMDLFFVAALGWGPTGGLDIGQAFYIASQITDGEPDSWVKAFSVYGDAMNAQAAAWRAHGWTRAGGEARLKAFAAYRSAWQFAGPGDVFASLVRKHKTAFAAAMTELALPATPFSAPYADKKLPGVFFQNPISDAPVVLVIGGADTCFEDLFLTIGRNLLDRGYSVALADLPGQGITQADGLHWEWEAEKPIAAVLDVLIDRFSAKPGRIALIGLSLGGYFVARAAGHDARLATVIASTPFPSPAQLFELSVAAAMKSGSGPAAAPTQAALRSWRTTFWKAGAKTPQELVERTSKMVADPALVTLPFLSILGSGDSPVFAAQARDWHRDIRSARKEFVLLDAATGADGHVQVNNRLRLTQEAVGWMDEIFSK